MAQLSRLEGIITPLITPCLNGEFDEPSFLRIADTQIKAGIDGLFILGTSGEFQYIPLAVKKRIIDVTAEHYSGKAKLLAGTTCDTLEDTIKLTEYAQEKGFDAVVLAPEYQMEMNALEYVRKVLEATQIPIVLYNYPKISNGRMLNVCVIGELSREQRVVGVKDSSGDMEYFAQLQALRSESFGVLQGSQAKLRESLQSGVGMDGCVLGSANLIPDQIIIIYKEGITGKFNDTYWEIFEILARTTKFMGGAAKAMKHLAYQGKAILSEELFPSNPDAVGVIQPTHSIIQL